MISKSKKIFIAGIIFGLAMIGFLAVGTYALEWDFMTDDNDFALTILLPENIVPMLEQHEAIISIEEAMTDYGLGYQVLINGDALPVSINEAITYLLMFNDRELGNRANTFPFPNVYAVPECHYDYGRAENFGVYWYDGEEVIIWSDEKC